MTDFDRHPDDQFESPEVHDKRIRKTRQLIDDRFDSMGGEIKNSYGNVQAKIHNGVTFGARRPY